jgi:hypothetical protein
MAPDDLLHTLHTLRVGRVNVEGRTSAYLGLWLRYSLGSCRMPSSRDAEFRRDDGLPVLFLAAAESMYGPGYPIPAFLLLHAQRSWA